MVFYCLKEKISIPVNSGLSFQDYAEGEIKEFYDKVDERLDFNSNSKKSSIPRADNTGSNSFYL